MYKLKDHLLCRQYFDDYVYVKNEDSNGTESSLMDTISGKGSEWQARNWHETNTRDKIGVIVNNCNHYEQAKKEFAN